MSRSVRRQRTQCVIARRMHDVVGIDREAPGSEGWLRARNIAAHEHPFGCPTGRCRCGACSKTYGTYRRAQPEADGLDGWWDEYGDVTESPSPSEADYWLCLSWWIAHGRAARQTIDPYEGGVLYLWRQGPREHADWRRALKVATRV